MSKAKKNKKSQVKLISDHLCRYENITTFEAFVKYNITRLSARIYDLREKGWIINSEKPKNKPYVIYRLVSTPKTDYKKPKPVFFGRKPRTTKCMQR